MAGIQGEIAWVSDWTAYEPRYVVIKIGENIFMMIGHMSAGTQTELKTGQNVNPDTVVGTTEDSEEHIHVEFWTGTGERIANRMIEIPYQYMSPEVLNQFIALRLEMDENDPRITFNNRDDGMWSSMYDQPPLIYNGSNLNEGQPGYINPWD